MLHRLRSLSAAIVLAVGSTLWPAQLGAQASCNDGTPRTDFKELTVVKECVVVTGRHDGVDLRQKTTMKAQLRDEVTVIVQGLAQFHDASTSPVDLHRLVLFLDGKPVKGPPVVLPAIGGSDLKFTLERDASDGEAWNTLLRGAIRRTRVPLSVGFEGQAPLRTEVNDFELLAVPSIWAWTWTGLMLGLISLLLLAARRSHLLRDPQASATTYSLARTQMAFWLVIVVGAYVFIWLVTGELNTLTSTVVGLMGIAAATAVAGGTIDAGSAAATQAAPPAPAPLPPAAVAPPADPAAAPPAPPMAAPPPVAAPPTDPSHGFFRDILSDGNGLSLPRVQTAAWTLVLGLIFARAVYRDLAMPQFDATMLGLMGISNGTYIGFKGLE